VEDESSQPREAPSRATALSPVYPVSSERIALRPLDVADVDALVAYRGRADVCRYVPFEPMDAEAVRARLAGYWARTTLEAESEAMTLGVELLATVELVGDVMLAWHSAEHGGGEIGYVLNPAFAAHGYATEAVHTLLHLAFDQLGLHRVVARVDAANRPSLALATRLGMRQEAHLVENEWFKGAWSDEVDFALLASEWRARHDAPAGGAPTADRQSS
jgi:RimJ/RimL family protein N-acetyltransferase